MSKISLSSSLCACVSADNDGGRGRGVGAGVLLCLCDRGPGLLCVHDCLINGPTSTSHSANRFVTQPLQNPRLCRTTQPLLKIVKWEVQIRPVTHASLNLFCCQATPLK
jgi:hypothetical protein